MSWILAVCHPRAGPQHVGAGNSVPENFEILSLAHGSKRGRKYLSFQNTLLEYNFLALKLKIFDRYVATWNMYKYVPMPCDGGHAAKHNAKQKMIRTSVPSCSWPRPRWTYAIPVLKPKNNTWFFCSEILIKNQGFQGYIKISSWYVTVVLLSIGDSMPWKGYDPLWSVALKRS